MMNDVQEKKEVKQLGKLKSLFIKAAIVSAPVVMPMAAHADEFEGFELSMKDLIQGSLGKSIALIALLLGGLIGLAKSSAWPALTGLAIAAVFGLGPFLIDTIFSTFSAIGGN